MKSIEIHLHWLHVMLAIFSPQNLTTSTQPHQVEHILYCSRCFGIGKKNKIGKLYGTLFDSLRNHSTCVSKDTHLAIYSNNNNCIRINQFPKQANSTVFNARFTDRDQIGIIAVYRNSVKLCKISKSKLDSVCKLDSL